MGVSSRRRAESSIKAGRLAVNGRTATIGIKIDPLQDQVSLDGRPLHRNPPPRVYWVLHKPDRVITSHDDSWGRQTVFDLPKLRKLKGLGLSTVGRLDFRTEGLLLLTNDGELNARMAHPRYELPRSYYVLINGKMDREQLAEVSSRTFRLEDGPVSAQIKPLFGKRLGATKGRWYQVTVREGRNRLVRRLFEKFGFKVVRLIRHQFGPLDLPQDLRPGEYRQLTAAEIRTLKSAVDL